LVQVLRSRARAGRLATTAGGLGRATGSDRDEPMSSTSGSVTSWSKGDSDGPSASDSRSMSRTTGRIRSADVLCPRRDSAPRQGPWRVVRCSPWTRPLRRRESFTKGKPGANSHIACEPARATTCRSPARVSGTGSPRSATPLPSLP
jgi:hypothetical protein